MATVTSRARTLGELRSHVYTLVDDDSGRFSAPSVDSLINNGLVIVGENIGVPYSRIITDTLPDVAEYSPPDPYVRGVTGELDIRSAIITTPLGAIVSLSETSSRDTGTGTPSSYVVDGERLYLSPVPDGVYTLTIEYRKEVTPLVLDTDTSILGFEESEVACLYAVWCLKMKDDEFASADRWRAMYEERLNGLKTIITGVYKPKQV